MRRSSAATSSSSSSSTTKDALDCACEDGANGGDWVAVATGQAFDDVSESGSDYKDGLIEPQDEAELVEMNEAPRHHVRGTSIIFASVRCHWQMHEHWPESLTSSPRNCVFCRGLTYLLVVW